MTTSQEQSCSECGQPANCPHMQKKPVVIMPAESSDYDPLMCKSFDHKHPFEQMRSIDYAMQEYFSDGLLAGSSFENWLEVRNKRFPNLK